MKKETPSFSANLTVGLFIYLRKKRKTYERKKMKKKRLKQKKIVVLSCFKFCWDSFLILWKTPSFSPHCCWNYYLLLYILLREKRKKWAGQPYKFPSHAHLLILWCPLLKEKKKISALRSYSHRLFQSSASQHKNKQTNKNHNVEKKKKNVFKTAIVIAVKKKNYEN